MSADAGRAWLAGLPDSLAAQRRVIEALLGLCERTPRVTSLSVGCSLGRGAADALSDIDAALGVADAAAVPVVEALVTEALTRPGPIGLVDLLRHQSRRDEEIRLIFAQFADRTQLDLAIVPQSGIRLGERPDFVLLYGAGGEPGAGDPGSAYAVTGAQVRDWAFRGWIALLDLDKYLRRGSLWEAHERLHQVRHQIWALWAAATGALYPWHGLSQVLDNDPGNVPPGVEATVAALDAADLRRAALASAALLATVSEAAGREHPADLPRAMAGYAAQELARG
jgi:hypothetical protein